MCSVGVDGRSAEGLQSPHGVPIGRLRELRCGGWRENTQQGTPAVRGGASLRGCWVSGGCAPSRWDFNGAEKLGHWDDGIVFH